MSTWYDEEGRRYDTVPPVKITKLYEPKLREVKLYRVRAPGVDQVDFDTQAEAVEVASGLMGHATITVVTVLEGWQG